MTTAKSQIDEVVSADNQARAYPSLGMPIELSRQGLANPGEVSLMHNLQPCPLRV